MKVPRPNRSKLQRAIKRRDKQRRNWCHRCPFRAPLGQCLDTTIRSGRCGDWVYHPIARPDGRSWLVTFVLDQDVPDAIGRVTSERSTYLFSSMSARRQAAK
jgi:hypothetical protein